MDRPHLLQCWRTAARPFRWRCSYAQLYLSKKCCRLEVCCADDQSVAIAVTGATPDHVKIIAYNLSQLLVKATMTGAEIDPGKWRITRQVQQSAGVAGLDHPATSIEDFERSRIIDVTFPSHQTTVLELKLTEKEYRIGHGQTWDYEDDVKLTPGRMAVTVHSLGSVDASSSKVVLRDSRGAVATHDVPALKAPVDLIPKTATVVLTLPRNIDLSGATATVEMNGEVPEIIQSNNRVSVRAEIASLRVTKRDSRPQRPRRDT
jgi:hypothetical protein